MRDIGMAVQRSPLSRRLRWALYGLASAWILVVIVFHFAVMESSAVWQSGTDASGLAILLVVSLAPMASLFAAGRLLLRLGGRDPRR